MRLARVVAANPGRTVRRGIGAVYAFIRLYFGE